MKWNRKILNLYRDFFFLPHTAYITWDVGHLTSLLPTRLQRLTDETFWMQLCDCTISKLKFIVLNHMLCFGPFFFFLWKEIPDTTTVHETTSLLRLARHKTSTKVSRTWKTFKLRVFFYSVRDIFQSQEDKSACRRRTLEPFMTATSVKSE